MVEYADPEMKTLLRGDPVSWRVFVKRHTPVIFAAVRRRLLLANREGDCDDVVQSVFMRLCERDYRLLRRFDPAKARLTTYLTVIATSTTLDHLRRQKPAQGSIDDAPESALAVEAKEPARVRIPDGLLSPRQALVLQLLYNQDLTPAEAAETMGVAVQTVRSMHHKALTSLRAHFGKELE
jgi:RNA polymerase sigma-70 factor (ECF subfamily)